MERVTKMNRIGIDLGATKIECCVINEKDEMLFRERVLTGATNGLEFVLSNIKTLYDYAVAETKIGEHFLGFCMPGSISYKTGLAKNSSIESINGTNFKQLLEEKLKHPVVIANDSHCFALSEAIVGAGKSYNSVLGVILGSGVGGGFVVNKGMLLGHHGIAGEWGHTSLDPSNNIKCRCGRVGCVETWLSGSGVDTWAKEIVGTNITTRELLLNEKVKDIYFEKFGLAFSNIIQILDPDCIVIGGGLSNNDDLYSLGVESIKRQIFNDDFSIPIVKAALGDSSGVIGAAFLG